MSANPPDKELRSIITKKHRDRMIFDFRKGLRNIPRRSVAEGLVEFTERKRVLVSGTSARPGPYRFAVTPYLREPADCLSEYSRVLELVIMKGTQTGGTDGIMMNHELYCIEYGIGPVQYVSSDDDLAQEHMEKRLDPMISAAGMQHHIMAPVKKTSNKSTGDTKRSKSYKGTFLRVTGSRSESKLSSLPSRILHIDEIDKYLSVLSGGGNPVEKAVRRTDSYGNLMKIVYISTPKNKETSQIEPLFEQGDKRYYYFQCPSCGEYQKLEWSNIEWDKDDDGELVLEYDDDGNVTNNPVWLNCTNEECDYKIRDHEKAHFLKEKGHGGTAEWIPTKKPDRPGLRSYHVNALYGFRSWLNIVIQWCKINGDKDLLQDFVNDTLGETFADEIDKPNPHFLAARAETDWDRGQVPDKTAILTMGVDVHPDRLEAHLVGFGNFRESWSVDYFVFSGLPHDPNDETWDKLEDRIKQSYEKVNGTSMEITACFIDAGGEASDVVHGFCDRFPYAQGSYVGVFPTFGKQTLSKVVREYKHTIPAPDVHIHEQFLKMEIYQNLKKKVPTSGGRYPGGFIHFHDGYNEDFFNQLTAEDVIEEVDKKGLKKIIIGNPKRRRNETLDTFKMALGALYFVYLKYFEIWNEQRKRKKQKEMPVNWQLFWSQLGCDTNPVEDKEE